MPTNENAVPKRLGRGISTGFTLIEMLAVITVIGILCSVLFKLAFYVFDQNDRSKAETELEAFRAMLGEYKISNRRFPQTEGLTVEEDRGGRLYMALAGLTDPIGNLYPDGTQRASLFRGLAVNVVEEKTVSFAMDPWESPYVYICPVPEKHNQFGARDYLLFSKGPDGRASSDSDGKAKDDEDNIPSNYPSGEY